MIDQKMESWAIERKVTKKLEALDLLLARGNTGRRHQQCNATATTTRSTHLASIWREEEEEEGVSFFSSSTSRVTSAVPMNGF